MMPFSSFNGRMIIGLYNKRNVSNTLFVIIYICIENYKILYDSHFTM